MPAHLPQLSRRQFLVRSLAAGAGGLLAPRVWSAARSQDERCFALLSDPHLAGDTGTLARAINMADQFVAVVHDVLAWPQAPAAAFVNGDLALNTGEAADYETLLALLAPLRARMPVHLTLGNHDHRERFRTSLRRERTTEVPNRQVGIVRTPAANWFLLDSLDKTMSTPGYLGAEQLQWLARALDANGPTPALVMIHHNPDLGGNKGALQETAQLLEVIRPRSQVKAYLYGHAHRWEVGRDVSGIHFVGLPTTAYRFDPAQPVGWVAASLGASGVRLELRCLDRTHPRHGRVEELTWRS